MTTAPMFVHLRVHSSYSLAEGMLKVDMLTEAVHKLKQPAVAVTDSFNTFAALEFSEKAAELGIQPIIGAQVILRDEGGHEGEVVLLVKDEEGWQNLSWLLSDALLEATEITPAIPLDALAKKSSGLILLSGGAQQGFIAGAIAEGQRDLAETRLKALKPLFEGRLYIELQRHGTRRESVAEAGLLDLAYKHDLPLVATNDCYFLNKESAPAHDILLCISQGTTLADESRRRETEHHYLKSTEEMMETFADLPEAVANSVVIAQRCAYRVPVREPILPAFSVPDGLTEAEFLRTKAKEGLEQRFASKAFTALGDDEARKQQYSARLESELDIIIKMGFEGYFLIVADFISWAKNEGIAVGPGRGSGAGSLVAYALTITDLDPIQWGLLFERFLNPERISMPDFDIDFCQDRRDEVIAYVQEKYGSDRVAQIITFGSLQARAALRDVGRVIGMPYGQVDGIAKMIPNDPANPKTLAQAVAEVPELKRARDQDEQVADLIRIASSLEGLYRHASTHAAGLVIGDRPLPDLVPLYRDPRSDMAITQFSMKWAEAAGLVKFDFLGLKTLTVLEQALLLINKEKESKNEALLTLEDIPLKDDETFALLSKGDTVGVFQLESSGMRDVLIGLKPDRFEDIIAVVSLYRPGPMENIPSYIQRKHGQEEVKYLHPSLEEVLGETYGIMIYQEQVQHAAQLLANYTLGGADILRRAMGKKIAKEMNAQRETFVKGAEANDIKSDLASKIFDDMAAFAGYGFNKSHAAAYALIAWQTAWLKTHYAADFLAASMTLDSGNVDKLAVFRQDCQLRGIKILPPDVNSSEAIFTVEQDGDKKSIRYALGAIKNVGVEAMRQLADERRANGKFTSLDDFVSRLSGVLSRRFLENLIKAGALDSIEPNRNRLLSGLDAIIGHIALLRREEDSSQDNLFMGEKGNGSFELTLPEAGEVPSRERLEKEFEALGLYISAHPLDDYGQVLEQYKVLPSAQIGEIVSRVGEEARITLAGIVTAKQMRQSRKGTRFAFLRMSDQYGVFEVAVFSEALDEFRELIDSEQPLLVKANVRYDESGLRMTANDFEYLDNVASSKSEGIDLKLIDNSALEGIKEGLHRDGKGKARLRITVQADDNEVTIELPGRHKLSPSLRQMLKTLPGIASMREII